MGVRVAVGGTGVTVGDGSAWVGEATTTDVDVGTTGDLESSVGPTTDAGFGTCVSLITLWSVATNPTVSVLIALSAAKEFSSWR